jgi:pyridinium-3,5-biscarboxylic acid mononucleotide sulfurtransferase
VSECSELSEKLMLATDVPPLAERLLNWFATPDMVSRPIAVALSGGVDSAVVAKAAALGHKDVIAVTARSASVSKIDSHDAHQMALSIGLDQHWVTPNELADSAYQQNDNRRCYYCKTRLYAAIAQRFPGHAIVSGTNLDDLGDYRPGLQAADEARVRAPLAELQIGKKSVRALAEYWQLGVADKPASPCLASRIAYGVEVTAERLQRIEQAEQVLRELGWREFRVRLHEQELVRIEIPCDSLEQCLQGQVYARIVQEFQRLGFRFVTLDLEGFRSGSLNPVPLVQIQPLR